MEKPFLENLQQSRQQSFLLREFAHYGFSAPYHFHPEFELTYILTGSGKRYVGSNMSHFADGDLVLLGSNLPHCWKLENPVTQTDAQSIVLQFSGDFLGKEFLSKNEMQLIQKLLHKSANGIAFKETAAKSIRQQLAQMIQDDSNFNKLIAFLNVLQNLALCEEYVLLDKQLSTASLSSTEQERHYAVWSYLVENFRKTISLTEVAAIAHMTPNAFCKYFKKVSRKTFIETVIELRLTYAIHQLIETNKSIAEIAFESGYNDVSQFHKNFKTQNNVSPLNYRKQFLKSITR